MIHLLTPFQLLFFQEYMVRMGFKDPTNLILAINFWDKKEVLTEVNSLKLDIIQRLGLSYKTSAMVCRRGIIVY